MRSVATLLFCLVLLSSCKTRKQNSSIQAATSNGLIKDCPEELISNQMPSIGKANKANQYYIYKGFRKEVNEFDSVWVSKHCKVKVTVVQ